MKLKTLFKSKKASFVIFAVIVLPTLIAVATIFISDNIREKNFKAKYQTALDNEVFVLANMYGTTFEVDGLPSCYFLDNSVAKASTAYSHFVERLDGFVCGLTDDSVAWTYSLEVVKNDGYQYDKGRAESTEYLHATLVVYVPNVSVDNYNDYATLQSNAWKERINTMNSNSFLNGFRISQVKKLTYESYSTKI